MRLFAPLCLLLMLVSLNVSAQTPATVRGREVLTNEAIISLAKARFKDSTIISLIRTSPTAFDLSTAKLVELKRRGVSEKVIMAMVERENYGRIEQGLASLRDDEFFRKDDEAFFNSSPVFKELPSEREAKQKEGEAMVFGSRSGNRSQNRSRGVGPSNEHSSEGEVMGSATVRIVRPPGEAKPEPKLERAPKLDNHAVLELVQAGFSEGTILRKIETSQVEFDTSPQALAELRQNRVSDRIIKAMTSAMDEGQK